MLKLDPSNITLLTQKNELLGKSISDTEKRLDALKIANEQAAASAKNYDAWKAAMTPIQTEIEQTKKKTAELKNAMQEMQDAGETDTTGYKELQSELTESTKKLRSLRAEAKTVNAEFGNPISPEGFRALQRETEQTEQKLGNLKNEAKQTSSALENAFKNAGSGAGGLKEKIDQIANSTQITAMAELADVAGGIGDKLVEIGKSAMGTSQEFGDAQSNMQANLGLTEKEAQQAGDVVKNVFNSGVTDSVEEAGKAVTLVKQNFGELDNTNLQNISQQLMSISDITGTDMQDNTLGASKLMQEYGLSAQEAMDLIAAGYQENLNKSGDFMDTLNEYSPLFEEAGFSAEQMMQIMKNGMENGAMNTDKVADAVKELQIKLGDGTFEENMGNFSQATQNTFKEWQSGKATVADVASSIGADLKKMSPEDQQKALSSLSSQFEDLGIDASVALFQTGDAFSDTTGKAKEFAKATPSQEWQSSINEIKSSTEGIGENLQNALQPILDVIADIAKKFSELPAPVQTFVTVLGVLLAAATVITPVVLAMAGAFATLQVSLLPIIAVIAGIALAIAAIITVIQNWSTITKVAGQVWQQVKTAISTAVNAVKSVITSVFNAVGSFITSVFNSIKSVASSVWNAIKSAIQAAVNAVRSVVTSVFNAVKSFVASVFNGIKSIATSVWNAIKTAIQTAVNGAKSVVTSVFNAIKSFVSTVTNAIKNAAVKAFNGLKNGIKSVVSGLANIVKKPFNTIKDFITGLASQAYEWGADFIGGLKDGIMSGVGKIVDGVKGIGDKIKSFLHFSRPDEGPLREYESWMPDFMSGLAKGIYNNIPVVAKAAKAAANAISINTQGATQTGTDIDYGRMAAVFSGAARNIKLTSVIDSRSFKRGLGEIGVQFE